MAECCAVGGRQPTKLRDEHIRMIILFIFLFANSSIVNTRVAKATGTRFRGDFWG